MTTQPQLKQSLYLIFALVTSLALAVWLRSLPFVGWYLVPFGDLVPLLFLPVAMTMVLREPWALILSPFEFWSVAWPILYLEEHLVFSGQQQLNLFIEWFTAASVLCGALGILVGNGFAKLVHSWRAWQMARPSSRTR
jgi:hypothetical protein